MYKAYTGDRRAEGGNSEDKDGSSSSEDEEVKDFQDKAANQKYDIKKQIS